ncbi:MAG: DUF3489 domain-containing protein [Erythrobacter sp.]|jgi:hypothetical protein|nr:DUF3489 domain-containing protein [Erythrobacter sp.]
MTSTTKTKTVDKASPKPATKLDTLEHLLARKNGASIAEMMQATDWQQHSVRGALAGALRKRGHAIISQKVEGTRRYRIAEKGA